MAESAHHLARIAVVVGVTTEGRIEAEFAAFVCRTDILVYGVHSLEDATTQLLEFA
jgi:hypothetical protein